MCVRVCSLHWEVEENGSYGNGSWQLRTMSSSSSSVHARLLSRSELDYPIGRKRWSVSGDVCGGSDEARTLTLTTCRTGQFTCDSGDCIHIDQVRRGGAGGGGGGAGGGARSSLKKIDHR